jgi:hypothetical protein
MADGSWSLTRLVKYGDRLWAPLAYAASNQPRRALPSSRPRRCNRTRATQLRGRPSRFSRPLVERWPHSHRFGGTGSYSTVPRFAVAPRAALRERAGPQIVSTASWTIGSIAARGMRARARIDSVWIIAEVISARPRGSASGASLACGPRVLEQPLLRSRRSAGSSAKRSTTRI